MRPGRSAPREVRASADGVFESERIRFPAKVYICNTGDLVSAASGFPPFGANGIAFVTNLAFPLTSAAGDEPGEDVRVYTISRIKVPEIFEKHR